MSDYISRESVLNTIEDMDKALDTDRTVEEYKALLIECIKALPSRKDIFEKEPEDYPKEERNCECCVNRTEKGCRVWDCHFESAY